jgi:glyoxylase-like metal-dependent hydrolase (beta-lactamase superfamily II)
MGVGDLQDFFSIPFFISKPDQFLVDRLPETVSLFIGKNIRINKPSVSGYLYPDMTLTIDKEILKIMTAPGHTPGSICLYNKMRSICFTGDTIFKGGALGRTDHVYSDCRKLIHSVKEILSLPGSTEIMPGHGEKTTVRKEIPYYEKD